ncbi:MAG: hypothetical protein L3J11_11690 [Draconibacterium sp.]|nr:hypothetical protein [Draconibacterium sp.]
MKIFSVILLLCILFFSFQTEKEKIIRIGEPAVKGEINKIIPHFINFRDTIQEDTLREYLGENGLPLKYSRKIVTGVCIDGKCRLVNVELFWNITGRYLGYELPVGEFLSKTEHVKFKSTEYDRLHHLLANPNSALASYSLKELVPEKDSTKTKVDAVSSATIAAVLDYIVEGAVYTTYTLWHIVYGQTKREIENITSEKLTSELVLELLNSNKLEDRIWALNHISVKMKISTALQDKLIEIISGNDIYLAERSLNSIKPELLTSEVQKQLSDIFDKTSFLQKRLILQKLKEAPHLQAQIATIFSGKLSKLNGTLTKSTLELFQIHHINNEETILEIEKLLSNKNRFIAKQAFRFLEKLENPDKRILKSISKYKKKNN